MGFFNGRTKEEDAAFAAAEAEVKSHIIMSQDVDFIAGKELVNSKALLFTKMYQMDDGTVCFNTTEPVYFYIRSINFAGPNYHEQTTQQNKSTIKSKSKKKGHGFLGAAVGTVLLPGAGTIAGAIVGSGSKKSKGESNTDSSAVITSNQVEDDSSTELILENTINQEQVTVTLRTKTVDYQKLRSFKVISVEKSEVIDEPAFTQKSEMQASSIETQSTDPVEELRRYKALLDDGIITDDEFNAKKKELLGL